MSAFDFLDGLTGAPAPAPAPAPTASGQAGATGFAFLSQTMQAAPAPASMAAPNLFDGLSPSAPSHSRAGTGLEDALNSFGLAPTSLDVPLPQLAGGSGTSAEPIDFSTASAAQLKKFLDARGVNHRSCVEKAELVALARKTAGVVDVPPVVQPRSTALVQGLGNAFALHGMTHLAPTVAASLDHELEVGVRLLHFFVVLQHHLPSSCPRPSTPHTGPPRLSRTSRTSTPPCGPCRTRACSSPRRPTRGWPCACPRRSRTP